MLTPRQTHDRTQWNFCVGSVLCHSFTRCGQVSVSCAENDPKALKASGAPKNIITSSGYYGGGSSDMSSTSWKVHKQWYKKNAHIYETVLKIIINPIFSLIFSSIYKPCYINWSIVNYRWAIGQHISRENINLSTFRDFGRHFCCSCFWISTGFLCDLLGIYFTGLVKKQIHKTHSYLVI